MLKPKRIEDKALLIAVRNFPCTVGFNCLGDVVPHHIKTKKTGGPDIIENIMPLCVKHHNEIHNLKTSKFIKDYALESYMRKKGWLFDEFTKKWWNEKISKLLYSH